MLALPAGQPPVAAAQSPRALGEADALYAKREDPASARRAAEIWAAAVARDPRNYEAAWKLARVRCWLGDHLPSAERSKQYELGMEAGRIAVAAQGNRAEGHYWLASNMGELGDLGLFAGLKYRTPVREEFEAVIRIDPGFDGGSGFVALGDWYLNVPAILGGSKTKAEEMLRRALTYLPDSTVTLYFLAQTLIAQNRVDEARVELRKAVDAPPEADWIPEDREWKQKARELLRKIGAEEKRDEGLSAED
jgi:tetratricopeptide (TPR) repeat protein